MRNSYLSRTASAIVVSIALAFLLVIATTSAFAAHDQEDGTLVYGAALTGSAEVPSVSTDTSGHIDLLVAPDTESAAFEVTLEDGDAITMAHLHCAPDDQNGPVFAFLFGEIPGGFDVDGTLAAFTLTDANILAAGADCSEPITDIESLVTALDEGIVYANVHSVDNPSGEVRGQLAAVPQEDDGEDEDEDEYDPADTNEDGFISVAEGVPFYGGIVHSLTATGSVGTSTALSLDLFPEADADGDYMYERTFTISDEIDDLTEAHIVVHGIDIDESAAYDGEKESSIAAGVPFEATVPAACGVITATGSSTATTSYYMADLSELNSTGVTGDVELTLVGDQLTVSMMVDGTSPLLPHAQHIHLGGTNECPPNTAGVMQEDEDEDEDEDNGNDGDNGSPGVNPSERIEEIRARINERLERVQDRLDEIFNR